MASERRRLIGTAWVLACLLVVLPLVLALHFSHRLGDAQAIARLEGLNAELQRRIRAAREQSQAAFAALRDHPGDIPCSATNVGQMRLLTARSGYLQGLGYLENDVLKCSTLNFGDEIALGEPNRIDPDGTRWWYAVAFPALADKVFNLSALGGYAAITAPELVIDILQPQSTITLAHISARSREVIRARGRLHPEWVARFTGAPLVFENRDYLVAIQPSDTGNTAVVAAMAQTEVGKIIRRVAWRLVPLGLAIGLLGAGGVYLYTRHRLSFKSELRHALENKEFFMVYQPVIELATSRCVGAEALIRWRRRDGQTVSPLVFIPAAEEHGLIQRVTLQVMEMVARDAADLIRDNPDTHIAINFSAEDLNSPETEARLQTLLKDAGAASSNILIEATERGLMTPEKARDVLISVRSSGFKVAIDDFGTGNSSLSYLATYDLDFLKIDKSFVDAIDQPVATARVAFHIIEIARSLGLQMIAEGVETEAQRVTLRDAGVQYAQGWLFGRPMPMRDLVEFIRVRNQASAEVASKPDAAPAPAEPA